MKKINLFILVTILVSNSMVGINAASYDKKARLDLPYATEKQKNTLEENYDRGLLPLSDTNKEKPIKVISKSYDTGSETTEIYSDGSSATRSITGGSCSSGSGYVTCSNKRVHQSYASYGAEFRADYTIVNGGYDYIRKVYNPIAKGLASQQSFNLVYNKEVSGRKAYAQLNYRVNQPGLIPDAYRGLRLTVGGNKAVDQYIYL